MEVIELPRGTENWTWLDFFKPGYHCYDIFSILKDSNIALSAREIAAKLKTKHNNIGYALTELVKRDLIIQSEKVKTPGGGKAFLFAINNSLIEQRKKELVSQRHEKPSDFTISGRWRKDVLKLIQESDVGLTPKQVQGILGLKNLNPVGVTLYSFFKQGLIYRCPVEVPTRIKGISNVHTGIYAKNSEAAFRALDQLMPDSVRMALYIVRNERKVHPCWILKEKTGINDLEFKQWFRKAFAKIGLIKSTISNFRTYYYHPDLPQNIVTREINDYKEKARQQILRLTDLGRLFEQKAVYTFVKYLESKGQEVKTLEGFPEKVPSWLRQDLREKYKEVVEDENGYEKTVWHNEVWKFDREPADYVIFSRDQIMGHRQTYILSIKKDFLRQYGVGYYSSFVGCVKMGRTKDGTQLPDFLSAIPVFVCGEAWGKNLWKFNSDMKGQAGIILTLHKMMEMIKKAGVEFDKEHLFQDLYEKKKVYEAYQNHESVLMGDKDVLELMKEKGFKIEVKTK